MTACLFLNFALGYFGSSFSYSVGIVECTHVDLLSLLNNVLQIYLIFFTHSTADGYCSWDPKCLSEAHVLVPSTWHYWKAIDIIF